MIILSDEDRRVLKQVIDERRAHNLKDDFLLEACARCYNNRALRAADVKAFQLISDINYSMYSVRVVKMVDNILRQIKHGEIGSVSQGDKSSGYSLPSHVNF